LRDILGQVFAQEQELDVADDRHERVVRVVADLCDQGRQLVRNLAHRSPPSGRSVRSSVRTISAAILSLPPRDIVRSAAPGCCRTCLTKPTPTAATVARSGVSSSRSAATFSLKRSERHSIFPISSTTTSPPGVSGVIAERPIDSRPVRSTPYGPTRADPEFR